MFRRYFEQELLLGKGFLNLDTFCIRAIRRESGKINARRK